MSQPLPYFQPQIHVFEDKAAWAEAVAFSIAERIARRLMKQPFFTLALTGGSTPRDVYHMLGQEPLRSNLDWSKVKIFFGDERAVGPEHADSNYRMANEAWLKDSAIPKHAIHRMEGESENLDDAARRYETILRREVAPVKKLELGSWPSLDLILLGMGDDGHCASLFPGTKALEENARAVTSNEVPQLKTHRLTLTFPALNAAQEVWFLVAGESKAGRVAEILNPQAAGAQLPSARVHPAAGTLHWWLDRAAAQQLPARHD